MYAKIRRTESSCGGSSLVFLYREKTGVTMLELNAGGWCDLNDLDFFFAAVFPGHELGSLSEDQLVGMAKRVYQDCRKERALSLQAVPSKRADAFRFFKQAVSDGVIDALENQRLEVA